MLGQLVPTTGFPSAVKRTNEPCPGPRSPPLRHKNILPAPPPGRHGPRGEGAGGGSLLGAGVAERPGWGRRRASLRGDGRGCGPSPPVSPAGGWRGSSRGSSQGPVSRSARGALRPAGRRRPHLGRLPSSERLPLLPSRQRLGGRPRRVPCRPFQQVPRCTAPRRRRGQWDRPGRARTPSTPTSGRGGRTGRASGTTRTPTASTSRCSRRTPA